MVAPGGHGCSGGCVVAWGGVHGCSGGERGCSGGGHAWLLGGGGAWDTTRYGDTINERAVRILLECILVPRLVFTLNIFRINKMKKYRIAL